MPIREDCVTRPHRTDILAVVGVSQEDTTIIAVSVDAVVVAGIVGIGDINGRINDTELMLVLRLMRVILLSHLRNVMLVVCGKIVKEVFASFNAESIGVLREVTVLEHVVDVIPNIFERDSCGAKVSCQHDVSDIAFARDPASESVLFALPLRGQYEV